MLHTEETHTISKYIQTVSEQKIANSIYTHFEKDHPNSERSVAASSVLNVINLLSAVYIRNFNFGKQTDLYRFCL